MVNEKATKRAYHQQMTEQNIKDSCISQKKLHNDILVCKMQFFCPIVLISRKGFPDFRRLNPLL